MDDKELNLLLKEKINQIQVPNDISNSIETIFNEKILKRKNNYLKYVASIIVFLGIIVSVVFLNIKYNENINENTNQNTNQNVSDSVQVDNLYGIIDVTKDENQNTLSFMYDINTKDIKTIFDTLDYDVVIAKVENISYTNFDTKYYTQGGQEYVKEDYVPVRTIADIKIIKSIRGDFKQDENLVVRAEGGILEYNEYMKYWDYYNMEPLDIDRIEKEYNDYINAGKEKVYISEFGKNDIKLEEGKTYMMFIRKMAGNEYFTDLSKNLLREYDVNTGMILNNDTKEYQDINSVLY